MKNGWRRSSPIIVCTAKRFWRAFNASTSHFQGTEKIWGISYTGARAKIIRWLFLRLLSNDQSDIWILAWSFEDGNERAIFNISKRHNWRWGEIGANIAVIIICDILTVALLISVHSTSWGWRTCDWIVARCRGPRCVVDLLLVTSVTVTLRINGLKWGNWSVSVRYPIELHLH